MINKITSFYTRGGVEYSLPMNSPTIISDGTTVPVFPNIAHIKVINDRPVCNKNINPGINKTAL